MHEFELKPSRWLGLLRLAITALALAAVAAAALPAGLRVALGVAVIGWGVLEARRACSSATVRVTADGRVQCLDQGEWRDAEVLGDSFVAAPLVVLRYRLTGRRVHSRVLLPDSAHAADLRRLRVALRWGCRTRSDT